MTYIIENANILKGEELCTTSFLVKNNQIAFMNNDFKRYSFVKMSAEPYIMTPTFCMFDPLPNGQASFLEKKNYYLNNFILKGCTTLLTLVNVNAEREFLTKLKQIKLELLSSPIDYIIGVKVPLKLLTPTFIRQCRREKIPIIFVDLKEDDDLFSVPWGWIREAMFPYNSPLVPFVSEDIINKKKMLKEWSGTLEMNKIPHLVDPLEEKVPLTVQVLSKIGIYPLKTSLSQGSEISYNLYKRNREVNKVDVNSLFHYHNDRLVITVHKGVVIRAANQNLFRSGYGELVKIRLPSFYSIT